MRLAFCLSVRGFLRLSIQQALALGAAQQFFGALYVGQIARRVAEIEL